MTSFPRARTIRFNEVQPVGPGVGHYSLPQTSFPPRGTTFVRAKRWNESVGSIPGTNVTCCKHCGVHYNTPSLMTTSTPSAAAKKPNGGGSITDLSMISHIASKPYDSLVTPAKQNSCRGCATYEKQLQDEVTARRILEDRVRLLMHENTSIKVDIEQNLEGVIDNIEGQQKNMEFFTAELINSLEKGTVNSESLKEHHSKKSPVLGERASSSDRRLTFISSRNVSRSNGSKIGNLDSLPASSSSDELSSDGQQLSSPEKPNLNQNNYQPSTVSPKDVAVSQSQCPFCAVSEKEVNLLRNKIHSMESSTVPSAAYAKLEKEFADIQEFLNSLEKELEPLHENSANGMNSNDSLREEMKCNLSLLREQVQSTADEMSRANEEAENAKLSKSDMEMKLNNLKQNFESCKAQNASLKEDVRDLMKKCCFYLSEKIALQDNLQEVLSEATDLNSSNLETLNQMNSLRSELDDLVEKFETVKAENELLKAENVSIHKVSREQEVDFHSVREMLEKIIESKDVKIFEISKTHDESVSKLVLFKNAVEDLLEKHQKIMESSTARNELLTNRMNSFNVRCTSLCKVAATCERELIDCKKLLSSYSEAFNKVRLVRNIGEIIDVEVLQLLDDKLSKTEEELELIQEAKFQLETKLASNDETYRKALADYEDRINEMRDEIEKLKCEVDDKTNDIDSLTVELEESEVQMQNHKQELFIKTDQIGRLSEQVESLEAMVADLGESKASLVNQVTTTDKALQSLKQENNEVLNLYNEMKAEAQDMNEQYQQVICEKDGVLETVRELRCEIEESKRVVKDLNNEIDSKCEQLKSAEEAKVKLLSKVSDVTAEYESEKAINTSLADKADEAYLEIEKLVEKVKTLEQWKVQMLAQEKDAENIMEGMRAQLNEAKEKVSEKANEIDELKMALHNINEEMNRRKSIETRGLADMEIWKSRVQETEDRFNQSIIPLQNENRILYEKIAEMQHIIRDLEESTDFKDYKEAFEKLAEERVGLQDELDAKNVKLELYRKEITDLQGKLLSREVQLNAASSECQKKSLKVEVLQKKLNEVEKEWDEKHEATIEKMNQIISNLTEEKSDVTDRLYHVETELQNTRRELDATTSKMLSIESEKEDVSAALEVKRRTNDEIVNKIYELIRVITKLELKVGIGSLSEEVKELEISNILNELDSSRDRLSQFEQYISEQETLLGDKENEIITVTSKYNELKMQLSVIQENDDENFQINEDFHRWQKQYDQLYAENQKLQDEYEKLKKTVEPFKDVLSCYDAEKRLLLEKSHSTEQQYEQLANRYADLLGHQNHRQKIKHINKLKCDNFRLQKENEGLRADLKMWANDVKNLTRENSDVSKSGVSRVLKTSATQNVFSSSSQQLSFEPSASRLADIVSDLSSSAISNLSHHYKMTSSNANLAQNSFCSKENSGSSNLS